MIEAFNPEANTEVRQLMNEFQIRCSEVNGPHVSYEDLYAKQRALGADVDSKIAMRCDEATVTPYFSEQPTKAHLATLRVGDTTYQARTLQNTDFPDLDAISDNVWRCIKGCEFEK